MKNSNKGSRRMVVGIKQRTQTPPKALPKKIFLGIRHKDDPSTQHSSLKLEKKK